LPSNARNYTLYIRDDVDYDEETNDKKLQLLPASATNINSYKD